MLLHVMVGHSMIGIQGIEIIIIEILICGEKLSYCTLFNGIC